MYTREALFIILVTSAILVQVKSQSCLPAAYLTATTTSQIFTSPNYPSPYTNSLDCVWYITAPLGRAVSLGVNDLELESGYDFIYTYDGPTSSSPLLYKADALSLTRPVTSSGNAMTFRFSTDSSITKRGFSMAAVSVPNPCGTNLKATINPQTFTSPGYTAGSYPVGLNCTWTFTADSGYWVKFTIKAIQTSVSDYVTVIGPYDKEMLRTSGTDTKTAVTTSTMRVNFISPARTSGKGFLAEYVATPQPTNLNWGSRFCFVTASTPDTCARYCSDTLNCGAGMCLFSFCGCAICP